MIQSKTVYLNGILSRFQNESSHFSFEGACPPRDFWQTISLFNGIGFSGQKPRFSVEVLDPNLICDLSAESKMTVSIWIAYAKENCPWPPLKARFLKVFSASGTLLTCSCVTLPYFNSFFISSIMSEIILSLKSSANSGNFDARE